MKKILIKTSGDVSGDKKLVEFAKRKAKTNNKVVIICGGGTQINHDLLQAGYKVKFGIHGRILKSNKEEKIVRKVLEEERRGLEKKIKDKNITVLSPILFAGSIHCHINGDNMIKAFYLGFDEIYVFTLKNRIKNKKEIFKNYPRVKIKGI